MSDEKALVPVQKGRLAQREEQPVAAPAVPAEAMPDVPVAMPKKGIGKTALVLLLVAALVLFIAARIANRPTSLTDEMQQHSKAKYEDVGLDKVFKVNGESALYGVTVKVSKISFRENETLLWVQVRNDNGTPLYGLAGVKAALVDQDGAVYPVDPFGGTKELQDFIPAKAHVDAILSFPVIKAKSGVMALKFPGMFTLDNKKSFSTDFVTRFRIP